MREKMKVKPREGFLVRKPLHEGGALLDPKGEKVPVTSYWLRQLKVGDVIRVDGEPKPKAEAPPKEPKIAKASKGRSSKE